MISDIGRVTLESGSAIEAAENAYAQLSEEEQSRVVNYPILQNYITEYVYFARACEVPWRFLSHLCRSPATP